MRLLTLEIIFMAFITITCGGRVNQKSLDSRQMADLQDRIPEEGRKDMPLADGEKNSSEDIQESNIIENQDKLLYLNKNIDLKNKKKYIIHHRGNRKKLADFYGEEHSDISDINHDGEEGDVHSKVDEPSKNYLDSSSILNDYSEEATEDLAKEFGQTINIEKENINTENTDSNHQREAFENDPVMNNGNIYKGKSDANNSSGQNYEEKASDINEKSDEYDEEIDDDDEDDNESYISPEVESFWDAVDTFIAMNPYSENLEKEDPDEPADLYDYLYTPTGDSPGIDNLLDLLHFIKDVGDALERIEKDIQLTDEKDPEILLVDLSNNPEVNENMAKKEEDNHMSHEGYSINKNAEKINKDRSNRSIRSNIEQKNNGNKQYIKHKPFSTSIGITFPLIEVDLMFSKFILVPFTDPFPLDVDEFDFSRERSTERVGNEG